MHNEGGRQEMKQLRKMIKCRCVYVCVKVCVRSVPSDAVVFSCYGSWTVTKGETEGFEAL